jgi:hypothetical protein
MYWHSVAVHNALQKVFSIIGFGHLFEIARPCYVMLCHKFLVTRTLKLQESYTRSHSGPSQAQRRKQQQLFMDGSAVAHEAVTARAGGDSHHDGRGKSHPAAALRHREPGGSDAHPHSTHSAGHVSSKPWSIGVSAQAMAGGTATTHERRLPSELSLPGSAAGGVELGADVVGLAVGDGMRFNASDDAGMVDDDALLTQREAVSYAEMDDDDVAGPVGGASSSGPGRESDAAELLGAAAVAGVRRGRDRAVEGVLGMAVGEDVGGESVGLHDVEDDGGGELLPPSWALTAALYRPGHGHGHHHPQHRGGAKQGKTQLKRGGVDQADAELLDMLG